MIAFPTYFSLKLPKIAVLTGGILAASAFAVTASPVTFMTQKELLSTIPGHTVKGKNKKDGTLWVQAYSSGKSKGTIKGVYGKDSYDAKWFVKGDKWCEDWGSGNDCWSVERVDANTLQTYKNDKPNGNPWMLQ